MSKIIIDANSTQLVTTREKLMKIPYFDSMLQDCENGSVLKIDKHLHVMEDILAYIENEYYDIPISSALEFDYLGIKSNNGHHLRNKYHKAKQNVKIKYILFVNITSGMKEKFRYKIFEALFGIDEQSSCFVNKIGEQFSNVTVKILTNFKDGPNIIQDVNRVIGKFSSDDYILIVPTLLINSDYNSHHKDESLLFCWGYNENCDICYNISGVSADENPFFKTAKIIDPSYFFETTLFDKIVSFCKMHEEKIINKLVFDK